MPDILIRGMEMPKSCEDCHDADLPTAIAWLEAKCPCAYGMNKQGVYGLRHKRHPDCPLVELPQHGDLIDRRELLSTVMQVVTKFPTSNIAAIEHLDLVSALLRGATVVIPAERSES